MCACDRSSTRPLATRSSDSTSMNCRDAAALVVNESHDATAAPTTARSPLEKPLSELTEEDIGQVTREDCRRFLKERGMRRPSWNKSQAIQQVISLKALLEGRPGAGDPPVSSFLLPYKSPRPPTPSHDAPSSDKNETSGSGGQVPPQKEPSPSPYRRRDPVPNPSVLDPVPTLRCPPQENRPAMESPPGQLTIFYDGQISVYEGVSHDKAKTIMQLAGSSENYWLVPVSAHPSRPPPPRFAASFPMPGGSSPSTTPSPWVFPPSPTGGGVKIPRLSRESAEEPSRPPRENEHAEEPTTRKASLQRYLEKRKDRFKGKKLQGVVPGTSMDMMYMNHKTMWCHATNEMQPISPPISNQYGLQLKHPTKVCLSFDLNDEAVED